MTNTIRTTEELLEIFADNISGNITPQDLRDFVVSTNIGKHQSAKRNVPVCSRTIGGSASFLSNGTDTIQSFRTVMFFPSLTTQAKIVLWNGGITSAAAETGPGNAVLFTAALEYGGNIQNINISNANTTLSDGTYSLTIQGSPVAWGTNATGTATVVGGQVVSTQITCAGSFYSNPTITLASAGSATFTATISTVASQPATFAGASSFSCPNLGFVTTDVILGAVMPAQTTACARICATVTSGAKWTMANTGTVLDSYTNSSDVTTATGAMATSASNRAHLSPVCVLGKSNTNGVLCIGDSITAYYYDTFFDSSLGNVGVIMSANTGYFYRAVRLTNGYMTMATPSTRISQWATLANVINRSDMFDKCNIVWILLGTNDAGNSRTINQITQDYTNLIARFHTGDVKVIIGTIPPQTSSTDAFRTLENQTKSVGTAARTAINNVIRNGNAFGADAWVDISATIEAPSDPELWAIPTTIYDSGTASGGTSNSVVDASKNWTTNQFTGKTMIVVSGTGSIQARTIQSNTSTTLFVSTAASTPLSPTTDNTSNYIITDTNTLDGVHPSGSGHARMAVALNGVFQ